jgi:hypothetical protein
MSLRKALLLPAGLAACLAAGLTSGAAQADGTATTVVDSRPYLRDGGAQETPVYEQFSVSARPQGPDWLQDLQIVARGWGRLTLGAPFDDNRGTGDLDSFFLEGKLAKGHVLVRAGRQLAYGGAIRATHLDGLYLRAVDAYGMGIEGWAGAPVAPRFTTSRGDALTGVRAFLHGSFDSELGGSFVYALRGGYLARKDFALDGAWSFNRNLSFSGLAQWSVEEGRLAEARVQAIYQPFKALQLVAEVQRTAPDLFLDRTSIFSVFSEERRDEAGGEIVFKPSSHVSVVGDYHWFSVESGDGHRAGLRYTWHANTGTSYGTELRLLTEPGNGYKQARLFGIRKLPHDLTLTIDLDAYWLEREVNTLVISGDHRRSFVTTASLGWILTPSWDAMLAGSFGVTPYFERRAEVVARLVYKFALLGGAR